MLQLIIDFFTTNVVPTGTAEAIGPLAIAAISSAISAGAGFLANSANKRTRVDVPPELRENISDLSNRNFFLSALQRAVNNDQGFFNINASLASRGIDSPAIAREQREALESNRQDAIVSGLDQLEGLRLNALQNAIGQVSNINAQNAQLRQQQINNRLGIINSAASGIGSSITQGFGQQLNQQNFDRLLSEFGSGGSQLGNFDVGGPNSGGLNSGIFGGFGGDSFA